MPEVHSINAISTKANTEAKMRPKSMPPWHARYPPRKHIALNLSVELRLECLYGSRSESTYSGICVESHRNEHHSLVVRLSLLQGFCYILLLGKGSSKSLARSPQSALYNYSAPVSECTPAKVTKIGMVVG